MNQVTNNQQLLNQKEALIFYMNYMGYTYEDGAVVSESFLEKENIKIGDKIKTPDGNKAIVSHTLSDDKMPYRITDEKRADILLNPCAAINMSDSGWDVFCPEVGPIENRIKTKKCYINTINQN
jgi:DNA-directed RNA polymerase beta subunit